MKGRFCTFATAAVVFLVSTFSSQAASTRTILTYTGKNFTNIFDDASVPGTYTTSMRVSVTIELRDKLQTNASYSLPAPLHFSISDGRNTITEASGSLAELEVVTDGVGNIVNWRVNVVGAPQAGSPNPNIKTMFHPTCFAVQCGDTAGTSFNVPYDYAYNLSLPGSWTIANVAMRSGQLISD
jgi:hypothetical protein